MSTPPSAPAIAGPPISCILHPTDLSPGSHAALALAVSLAERHGALLHVLHVASPRADDEASETAPCCGTAMQELRRLLPPRPGFPLVATTSCGDATAAPAILRYAAQYRVDLIVMGARRLHRGFGHLIGSVAREVADGAECPVLTVRHDQPVQARETMRLLVPLDFSPAAGGALDLAAAIARRAGGELVLLHVVGEPAGGLAAPRRALRRGRLRTQARSGLRAAAASVGGGVRVSTLVRAGNPVDEIVRCAAEQAVDLIVLRSHASPARRRLTGSIAEEVQRFASAPVLLVKTADREERRAAG